MDLSDGLAGDLPKLAAASGLAAHVEIERLPLSDSLRAYASEAQSREWAPSAGDDYELLLSVPAARQAGLEAAAAASGLKLTVIGQLLKGQGVTWSIHGCPLQPLLRGFDHFR
jgi:thiamine-monophosphate kinase